MRRHLRKLLPDRQTIRDNPWLRPFEARLLHPRLWHLNRHSAAGAVAAGLFCGLIPGPFQLLGAAVCAVVFRVNLALAVVTTFYTNPFTIVPLYIVAYEIGRIVTGDVTGFIVPPAFDGQRMSHWLQAMSAWVIGIGRPLGIGLAIMAPVLAVLGYLAVKAAWRVHLIMAWRGRHRARSALR